jgi:hypothetical protein
MGSAERKIDEVVKRQKIRSKKKGTKNLIGNWRQGICLYLDKHEN